VRTVDSATLTTVDRLGLDIRVTSGQLTDEFRIGFRQVYINGCHNTVDEIDSWH
jgi:hypothetical protein